MSTKHSPGPWKVHMRNRVSFPMRSTDCSKGTWSYGPDCNFNSFYIDEEASDELRANAALIALAPEMFEALRICLYMLDANRVRGDAYESTRLLIHQVINRAKGIP